MSFAGRLKQRGLLPSTRDKYEEILDRANTSDLVSWMRKRVNARTPLGTMLPMRAAVKHYLVGELGYDEEEVDQLLPKARGGKAQVRHPLSAQQLATYHFLCEEVPDPARTILMLLPQTGLRISEACSLRRENIKRRDGRLYLDIRGKGNKQRFVPLTRSATQLLQGYLQAEEPKDWLFLGYKKRPIGPAAVRVYTRSMAEEHPELEGLCPHVLRHTFATMTLKRGGNVLTLQALMGHENLQTTQRYVKQDLEDLTQAVDLLD